MKIKTNILIILFAVLFIPQMQATPGPDEGRDIFTTRCMGCHNVQKDINGPALMNLEKRHSIDWIIKFINSSQAVIKGGDTSAIALFAKFNNTVMPDQLDLSDDNIKSVVEYIKDESTRIVALPPVPLQKPFELQPNYAPMGTATTGFIVSFILAIMALILVLLFSVYVKKFEKKKIT